MPIYCSFCLRGVNQGALLGGVGRGPGGVVGQPLNIGCARGVLGPLPG